MVVATPDRDSRRLAGYFTMSAGSAGCADLPESPARRLPRYPVPVALIGRLAVDSEFQRKGLGSILLADACRKVVQASAVLAVAGIVVDAKDESAAVFYTRFSEGLANQFDAPQSRARTHPDVAANRVHCTLC